jgi:hypothetical protein
MKILIQIITATPAEFDIRREFTAAARADFFNLFWNIERIIRLKTDGQTFGQTSGLRHIQTAAPAEF